MKIKSRYFALTAVLLCIQVMIMSCLLKPTASKPANNPVLLGVNMAGDWHSHINKGKDFYEYEAWYHAMDDLGAQFVDINLLIQHYFVPIKIDADGLAAKLKDIDQKMTRHGLKYLINNEVSNRVAKLEFTPGINELENHGDGTHRWDLRMEWINQLLPPQRPGEPALMGINYDESDHMILWGSYGTDDHVTVEAPYLVNTNGVDLEKSYEALVAACQRLRDEHYKRRLPIVAELGFPDMVHIFARAGWVQSNKMIKECVNSVNMATFLGAAIQYADTGTDVWACNDLWKLERYPGWSPEALRSSLLMSYWIGASKIFVENMDYGTPQVPRHPLASPTGGALVAWKDADHYELTNHGKVVQDVFKNYIPTHPRTINWRDYRPSVAFVRMPDGDWGQKGSWYRDRLLGNREHPSDEVSREWLHVWPILTHGIAQDGAISLQNTNVYKNARDFPVLVPINNVAVFDHLVKGPVLDSVECFIVCGQALSKETFEEISRRVQQGKATCIIARRLYDKHAQGALPGDWLVVDQFTDPAIAARLKPFLGPTDVARFCFKGKTVEFRPGQKEDSITVNLVDNKIK